MIDKIKLTNWRKHKELELDFTKGSNIIIGRMGSGKTSILQAIAYGLFGTFSELKKRDLKTSDLINKHSKEKIAEIELHIRDSHNNKLIITRKIESDKTSEGSVKDSKGKLLAGPNPTAVNFFIADKLKIDEDLFLRAVYSIQNETDILLRLTPADRKKQVDELMNLDRFEIARKTCVSLRNKLNQKQKNLSEVLDKENKTEVDTNINLLIKELGEIKERNVNLSAELKVVLQDETKFKNELDTLRKANAELNQLTNRKKSLDVELSEIKLKLAGKEIKLSAEEIAQHLQSYEHKKKELTASKSEFNSHNEKLNTDLMKLEKLISIQENKLQEFSKRISEINTLRQKLTTMESEHKFTDLSEKIANIRSREKELDNQYREHIAEMNSLRKYIQELEIAADICPICRNHLTITAKDNLISERKQEIAKRLMENNELQTEQKRLEKQISEFEGAYKDQSGILEKIEIEKNIHSERDKLNLEFGRNAHKIQQLTKQKQELDSRKLSIENELNLINTETQNLLRDKYAIETKGRETKLSAELNIVENKLVSFSFKPEILTEAEGKYNLTIRRSQEIKTSLENSETIVKEKDLRLKELKERLSKLKQFEKEVKKLGEKVEFLDKLKNAIMQAQEVLRDELILAVNEVMASVWLEIYPYDSWISLRLSTLGNDYTLQLKEPEGDWINVSGFASGGERMLASLAAKIAFARVLAPSVSMLILDEPTHNLDEIAVRNLIEIIHENVSEFIDQTFIITHDERLAESANKVVKLV
tara:strand:- start:198 stop:2492 length:2295 start_codon:yes stop_codon:yes gene_type:complete